MKKFIMSCAIAIASLSAIACNKAEAADTFVGGTVDFLHTSELDTTLVGVTAGVALNEVVSVEAKVQQTLDKRSSAGTANTGVKATLVTVGVSGTQYVTDSIYARGLVGATWSRLNVDGVPTINSDPTLTVSVGAGYTITPNVAVETNYTYANVRGNSYGVTDTLDTNQFGAALKYFF